MQEFAIREIRKIPYENPFFPRQALPIFFDLHSHWIGDAPYRVWFDLDNSLTRWKRPFFKILFFCELQKFPYVILTFFPYTVYQKIFCFTLSLHWWYSIPHLIWFGQLLNPMKKTFLKNSQKIEIREVCKSQYEDPLFSLGKLYQKFFLLYTLITLYCWYSMRSLVWFGQLLDPMKMNFFLNSQKFARREVRQSQYEDHYFS